MAEKRDPKRDPRPGDTAVSDGIAWAVTSVGLEPHRVYVENLRGRQQGITLPEWAEMKQHTASARTS